MTDLYRALAEIDAIRGQVARATEFRGYGPATLAATGLLAVVAAIVQSHVLRSPSHATGVYLIIWIATAALALIEPAILIVMGIVVVFILISLYLPIFSMGQAPTGQM